MPPARSSPEGKEQAAALVRAFAEHSSYYVSAAYDETSTRERFINPLFEALGWDVLDAEGRGPLRDVIFHQRLHRQGGVAGEDAWDEDLTAEQLADRAPQVRIPDYAFRVHGALRFFVEAKRPNAGISRRGPAFQVKSYAWTTRIGVSVLTDFRQLRAFDCRTRPDYQQPSAGLLPDLDLTYTSYPDVWDTLWSTFSREAVAAGSLDRLTGVRARGALPVDEAFLRELTGWRAQLAQDLVDRNEGLDQYQVAEATQRILDRLVFLRVVEDRGVEPNLVLRRYARTTDAYRQVCHQFRRLDGTYNGQLFAEHFSERLEVGDGLFQHLVASLYPPAPYRFDVIGADLLGAVYERFLGKEIIVADHTATLVDKPEVRHAGGVYYTPRWVVDHIVATTLSAALAARTTRKRTRVSPADVAGLRVLDPACGSGSFLLGALDWLINWHEHYYTEHPDEDPGRHYLAANGLRQLTSDTKAALVTTCLYGVDVDPQAVEVAQMSLYLRILQAETASTLGESQQIRLFHGALLPSLSRNIRDGNSLLSDSQVPPAVLFDTRLARRINPLDWTDDRHGFGQLLREHGGFDAVIGNPPYTRVQVLRRERPEETRAFEQSYRTASGSFDIAGLFVEKALTLLRPAGTGRDNGGQLGFIVSRQFTETDAGTPVRRLLTEGGHLVELVDFSAGLVFEASAYTVLLHASAGANPFFRLTRVPPPPSGKGLQQALAADGTLSHQLPAAELDTGTDFWTLTLPSETALLERLAATHPSLGAVSGNSIFQGVVTGADPVYRALDAGPDPDRPDCRLTRPQAAGGQTVSLERALLRPVLAGRSDLRRFRVDESAEWLLLPYRQVPGVDHYALIPPVVLARDAPRAFAWLKSQEDQLQQRWPGGWTEVNWSGFSGRKNLEKFERPKVLVPYMVDELCASYDTDGHFFVNVATGGYGVELDPDYGLAWQYVAALLNSELLSWTLRFYSRAFRGGWFAARKGNLQRLPVACPGPDAQQQLVKSYQRCQALAAARNPLGSADARRSERLYDAAVQEFDDAVFGLYELSDAEVAVVRSSLSLDRSQKLTNRAPGL